MPTVGQALQQTLRTPPPGPGIRTVVSATTTTVDVGFGSIVNATGTTPAAGARVLILRADEAVWVAAALLP